MTGKRRESAVVRIERDAVAAFARILCQPAGGDEKNRYLLALQNETRLPAYPVDAAKPEPKVKGVKGKSCEALTKPLEDALGKVANRGYKPEYRMIDTATAATRQKIGG